PCVGDHGPIDTGVDQYRPGGREGALDHPGDLVVVFHGEGADPVGTGDRGEVDHGEPGPRGTALEAPALVVELRGVGRVVEQHDDHAGVSAGHRLQLAQAHRQA